MSRLKKRLAMAALIAGGLFMPSLAADNFRVYGFMDGTMEAWDLNHSYTTALLSDNTFSTYLGHANLYFDWNINDNLKALIETNLAGGRSVGSYSQGFGDIGINYEGEAISDDRFIEILTPQLTGVVTQMVQAQEPLIRQQIVAGSGGAFTSPEQVPASMVQPMLDSIINAQVAGGVAGIRQALPGLRYGARSSGTSSAARQQLTLERAYFDLNLAENLSFRFGKWITPAGIWNVDHASPVVLTVRQPIQTTITPIFPESQLGAMLLGRQFLGDHELEYNLYMSTGRDGASSDILGNQSNKIDEIGQFSFGGHAQVNLDVLDGIRFGLSGLTGTVRNGYSSVYPYYQATDLIPLFLDPALAADPQAFGDAVESLPVAEVRFKDHFVSEEREYVGGVDTKIGVGNITVQGELNYRYRHDLDDEDLNRDVLGWYGLISYRQPLGLAYSVTPYFMFEQVKFTTNNPALESDFGLEGFNTYVMGLNFSIHTNMRLKLEYDYFQFPKDDSGLYPDITEKDLTAGLFNTQLSVAF